MRDADESVMRHLIIVGEVGAMPDPKSPRVSEGSEPMRADRVRLMHSPSVPAGRARRARMVLLAADGTPIRHSGPTVGVRRARVRSRLRRAGPARLRGSAAAYSPRRGAPRYRS